jgi:tetratricopeptide (TPR) repeat protein
MNLNYALSLVLATVVMSCATAPTEISIDRLDEEVAQLETQLDHERWDARSTQLQQMKNKASNIMRSPLLSRNLQVRTLFLMADISQLLKDKNALQDERNKLAQLGEKLPQTLIASAWLAPHQAITLLQEAPPPANKHPRLLWELGLALASANRHSEAAFAFDQALQSLPAIWKERGKAIRDLSWNLRQSTVSLPTGLNRLGEIANPTVQQFWQSVRDLTPSPGSFPYQAANQNLNRAILAEWVLHYVAEKRNTPELRTRQSQRLRARPNAVSPIADVSLDSPHFDAAVFCAERGYLNLIEGRMFKPEMPVSGPEAVGVINKVTKDF